MRSLLVLAWVLGLLLAAGAEEEKEPADAVVQSIKGQVELRRAGAEQWQPAKEGDELWAGDAVKTGKRSRALIKMGTNIEIKLSSSSQLLVRPQEGEPYPPGVALLIGRLLARVVAGSEGQPFEVETTNAVAGVRGTVFSVAVGDDGASFAAVDEGKVELQGAENLLLEPGQAAEVEDDQKPARLAEKPKLAGWLKARRARLAAKAELLGDKWRQAVEEHLVRLREGGKKLAELKGRLVEIDKRLASARRAGREKMLQAAQERLQLLRRELRAERRRLWRLSVGAEARLELLGRLAESEGLSDAARAKLSAMADAAGKLRQGLSVGRRETLRELRWLLRLESQILHRLRIEPEPQKSPKSLLPAPGR